ncbi:oxygenase MpaB family protein [Streptomyces sp. NPDC020965]|uniref:oxygenase MpaB family protein n=1 Tax=Streptomyces sp. NPDC020965 TaxID=3365105 RepID=UPI0037B76BEE
MESTALPQPDPPHPESLFRSHLGEWRMLLVAWRLLVLQTSHPVVGAGTAEHSTYRAHPWRRIEHTMGSGQRLVFADQDTLLREVARLNRAHKRIMGTDEQGRAYSAHDPATRVWILITLYESVVAMRELSGDPLTPAELERLYAEFRQICAPFALPDGLLPATAAEVPTYVDTVVRERLELNAPARYLLFDMLREAPRPRRLRLLGPFWPLLRPLIAAAMTSLALADLPPAYRERFKLPVSRRHTLFSRLLHHGARRIVTRLPDRWRYRSQGPRESKGSHGAPGSQRSAGGGTRVHIPGPRHAAGPRRWHRDGRGARLAQFFSQVLDQTGDGFVGATDLRAMAHNICWQLELDDDGEDRLYAAFDVWWQQLRRSMDTDSSGRITRAEFVAATLAACDRDPEYLEQGLKVAVRAVFRAADSGRSGFIEADEYRVVFGTRSHPAELSHGFRQLDRDGDGRLTEDEFVAGFTEFFTSRGSLTAGTQLLGRP